MKELSLTHKVLIGTGAVVLAAAATVGVMAIVKKLKQADQPVAVLEFDEDAEETQQDEA